MRPVRTQLACVILLLSAVVDASSATLFYDDFSDGSVTNDTPLMSTGTPVRWHGQYGAQLTVRDEDFVVSAPNAVVPTSYAPDVPLDDVSLRSQVRLEAGGFVAAAVRYTPFGGFGNGYFAGIGAEGHIVLGIASGPNSNRRAELLAEEQTDLRVMEQDVLMQLDAIDDQISLWLWSADKAMPQEPIISVSDTTVTSGTAVAAFAASEAEQTPMEIAGVFRYVHVSDTHITDPLLGDFNQDGTLDMIDITLLSSQIYRDSQDLDFDVNRDGSLDQIDQIDWVHELRQTWFGDANLDGQFDTTDLVEVLASGTYEEAMTSDWSRGDFDGDGRTRTSDLILALADGGYETGPRPAAVPEPHALILMLFGCSVMVRYGAA